MGIFAFLCGSIFSISAQTTNVIPTNVFPTDDGFLFWYNHNGRVIATKKIKEAENSKECRPADEDPEGHWGTPSKGLQLSLRFEKQTFTNGEPIEAVILIRDITNQPVVYFRPTRVKAMKDGKVLKRKDDTGVIIITMPPETTLFAQTQQKNHERLDQIYDLSQDGKYVFQAECRHPEITSQKVTIVISK